MTSQALLEASHPSDQPTCHVIDSDVIKTFLSPRQSRVSNMFSLLQPLVESDAEEGIPLMNIPQEMSGLDHNEFRDPVSDGYSTDHSNVSSFGSDHSSSGQTQFTTDSPVSNSPVEHRHLDSCSDLHETIDGCARSISSDECLWLNPTPSGKLGCADILAADNVTKSFISRDACTSPKRDLMMVPDDLHVSEEERYGDPKYLTTQQTSPHVFLSESPEKPPCQCGEFHRLNPGKCFLKEDLVIDERDYISPPKDSSIIIDCNTREKAAHRQAASHHTSPLSSTTSSTPAANSMSSQLQHQHQHQQHQHQQQQQQQQYQQQQASVCVSNQADSSKLKNDRNTPNSCEIQILDDQPENVSKANSNPPQKVTQMIPMGCHSSVYWIPYAIPENGQIQAANPPVLALNTSQQPATDVFYHVPVYPFKEVQDQTETHTIATRKPCIGSRPYPFHVMLPVSCTSPALPPASQYTNPYPTEPLVALNASDGFKTEAPFTYEQTQNQEQCPNTEAQHDTFLKTGQSVTLTDEKAAAAFNKPTNQTPRLRVMVPRHKTSSRQFDSDPTDNACYNQPFFIRGSTGNTACSTGNTACESNTHEEDRCFFLNSNSDRSKPTSQDMLPQHEVANCQAANVEGSNPAFAHLPMYGFHQALAPDCNPSGPLQSGTQPQDVRYQHNVMAMAGDNCDSGLPSQSIQRDVNPKPMPVHHVPAVAGVEGTKKYSVNDEEMLFQPGDVLRVQESSIRSDYLASQHQEPDNSRSRRSSSASDSSKKTSRRCCRKSIRTAACPMRQFFHCSQQNHHIPDYTCLCVVAFLVNPFLGILALTTNAAAKRYQRRGKYNYAQNLYMATIILASLAVYLTVTVLCLFTFLLPRCHLDPLADSETNETSCNIFYDRDRQIMKFYNIDEHFYCKYINRGNIGNALLRFYYFYRDPHNREKEKEKEANGNFTGLLPEDKNGTTSFDNNSNSTINNNNVNNNNSIDSILLNALASITANVDEERSLKTSNSNQMSKTLPTNRRTSTPTRTIMTTTTTTAARKTTSPCVKRSQGSPSPGDTIQNAGIEIPPELLELYFEHNCGDQMKQEKTRKSARASGQDPMTTLMPQPMTFDANNGMEMFTLSGSDDDSTINPDVDDTVMPDDVSLPMNENVHSTAAAVSNDPRRASKALPRDQKLHDRATPDQIVSGTQKPDMTTMSPPSSIDRTQIAKAQDKKYS